MEKFLSIPENLFVASVSPIHLDCTICGASVTGNNAAKHRKFHELLLQSILNSEVKVEVAEITSGVL